MKGKRFVASLFLSCVVLNLVAISSTSATSTEYWAVICGVSDYPGTANDLNYCDDDAMDMRNTLVNYHNWHLNHITMLIDSAATKSAIQNAISTVSASEDSGDVFLFFFSGHGTQVDDVHGDEADGKDEAICPYDIDVLNFILDDELEIWLDALDSGKIVVILDTCYSGGFLKSMPEAASVTVSNETQKISIATETHAGRIKSLSGARYVAPEDSFAKDLDKAGRLVLTACDDAETGVEGGDLQNGAFTYYLVEGMGSGFPANSDPDSLVSGEEAFQYAAPRTTSYCASLDPPHSQHPQSYDGVVGEVELTGLLQYYLTVNTDPPGLDAPTGEGWYDEGVEATISVSPVPGGTFEYWYLDGQSGTPYSTDMTTTVIMDGPHTATAKFSGTVASFFHTHTEFWFTWYDRTGPVRSTLSYDDGVFDWYFSWLAAGPISAVRFTSSTSATLKEARFAIWKVGSFKVHVMDGSRRDMISPFVVTPPTGDTWYVLDLSTRGIKVSGDFYIGVEWITSNYPKLYEDKDAPIDLRSWDWTPSEGWVLWDESDYMIRAVTERIRYGAQTDNIHFVNPSASQASVIVEIGGSQVDSFSLDSGTSTYRNYPGVVGGPVHVTSSQPIWVTRRIVGWNSFKEVPGLPGDVASTEIYYTWYDKKNAQTDNIHFLNPSPTETAHVEVYIAGQLKGTDDVSPRGASFKSYPGVIGGPVRIVSNVPIYSTQRIVGWSDFDEVIGTPPWYAFTEHWFTWYDFKNAQTDNIHLINLGGAEANVEIFIGGISRVQFVLLAGQATYKNFPGVIGGPVRVVSDQPVRVTQRIVGWNGFKELLSVPTELFCCQWYYNWYDFKSTQCDNIHFLNPGTSSTKIEVYIAGQLKHAITLDPGQAGYVKCPGLCAGPVSVVSEQPIMTTQRIVGWSSFEETIGIQWA